MSNPLPSPPTGHDQIGFTWFNWFKKLYRSYKELYDYVLTLPTTQGGNLKTQLLTIASASPWTWPTNVDGVWVTAIGGGGGGNTRVDASYAGGGGGSGEYCVRYFYPRGSATTTAFTVGAGGAVNSNGGTTTWGNLVLKAGTTGVRTAATGYGGKGGGDVMAAPSTRVAGLRSIDEGVCTFSGANGGGGGSGSGNGFAGGGSEMWAGGTGGTYASFNGGGGGAASPFGAGGNGASDSVAATSPAATAYGAGGGGGCSSSNVTYNVGVAGREGCILLEWIGA